MATAATSGYGSTIKIGDGGGTESFTTIGEVTSINGPGLKLNLVEASNMDGGGWVERIATLKDAGEISIEMNFLPANATQSYSAGLIKDLVNKTLRNFKITFSNSGMTAWIIPGFVTSAEPTLSVEGKLGLRVNITGSGAPTLA